MRNEDDAEVYRKYSRELIGFAGALVGPSAAEDVFATAVVRAFTAPRWAEVENKRSYLYRTVLNEANRLRRSTRRRLEREIATAQRPVVDAFEVDRDVLVALRRLTVRQRAAVFLTYWADLPPGEIARNLGWSVRTVERELTAARRRLEGLLG